MAKIKRFGVLKMASFMGIYGAVIGLLAGIFVALLLVVIPPEYTAFGLFGQTGFFLVILYPIFYGVGGFVGGLILTPIINLILKIIKGIDLDIEMDYSPSRTQARRQPLV